MSDTSTRNPQRENRWKSWVIVAGVAGVAAGVGGVALLVNIVERKVEASQTFVRLVELTDTIEDPAVWGRNYPRQYNDYLRTAEMVPTRYGGSYAVARTPTDTDPRDSVAYSKIEKDRRLARMWAGYAFSVDFREERGHIYNFTDQKYTRRQTEFKQPGTCLNCHASTYVTMLKLGDGDIMKGFEAMNAMPYGEASKSINHPVACVDCHSPQTMELRITRPGLIEGLRNLKLTQGVKGYDVNGDATRQEMRTYVCAQCHVEYYFKGDEKRLTFPWHKGLQADSMYSYYDQVGFRDWVHKETGAQTLKAQHPEYEMFQQGIHARAGVACADCHMPPKREGGMKISDHHVRSPLLNVNRSCQTCHRASETELVARVHQIQGRHVEMVGRALDALMALIDDLSRVQAAEGETARVVEARELQRKASWFVDFVEAENSAGFHAPQEAARLLGMSIDYARQGQLVLSGGTRRSTSARITAAPAVPEPAAKKPPAARAAPKR
jgi:nitrite reductase (cytochrome c-552)